MHGRDFMGNIRVNNIIMVPIVNYFGPEKSGTKRLQKKGNSLNATLLWNYSFGDLFGNVKFVVIAFVYLFLPVYVNGKLFFS